MAGDNTLRKPLAWYSPRLIFVNSMSDIFHESLSFDDIARIWGVMAVTPYHTYQILTKRPDRMRDFLLSDKALNSVMEEALNYRPDIPIMPWPLPNIWAGTSVEDQPRAKERIQILLEVNAAVRFLSIEPLLGPVRLSKEIRKAADWKRLHWVIVGGESGPNARPMHPEWASAIREECATHRVKFFFKQVGSHAWVKDGKAKEFLGVDGRISSVRQRKTDQGLLRGLKESGGRRLDGKMHEAMPDRSLGFANFFAGQGNRVTLEQRMREIELAMSCRDEDIAEFASRPAW